MEVDEEKLDCKVKFHGSLFLKGLSFLLLVVNDPRIAL